MEEDPCLFVFPCIYLQLFPLILVSLDSILRFSVLRGVILGCAHEESMFLRVEGYQTLNV